MATLFLDGLSICLCQPHSWVSWCLNTTTLAQTFARTQGQPEKKLGFPKIKVTVTSQTTVLELWMQLTPWCLQEISSNLVTKKALHTKTHWWDFGGWQHNNTRKVWKWRPLLTIQRTTDRQQWASLEPETRHRKVAFLWKHVRLVKMFWYPGEINKNRPHITHQEDHEVASSLSCEATGWTCPTPSTVCLQVIY